MLCALSCYEDFSKPLFTFITHNISQYTSKRNFIYVRKKTMAFHWQIFTKHKNAFCSDLVHRVSLSLDNKGGKQEYNFMYALSKVWLLEN
jgi:hypothetical protein